MTEDFVHILNSLSKSYLLIVFPPHHHGNAIGRIISSHKEFYWTLSDCNLPYDDFDSPNSLTWPEKVDYFGLDRAISEKQFTRKQALLGMYRRVHGGLFFAESNLFSMDKTYFEKRASFAQPGSTFTLLHHANQQIYQVK